MSLLRILLSTALLASLDLSLPAQEPETPSVPAPSVQERAESLLQRARRLSDIRAKDAPAFRLKATFSFVGDNLDTVEGTYTETWFSSAQWRRETIIGNLKQIDVGGAGKHWLVYPDGFPVQAAAVPGLMAFLPSASLDLAFSFIRDRASGDVSAECAFSSPVIQGLQFVFCFEKKSGVLLEKMSPERRPRNIVSSSCEYGTFRKFGEYTFPREVMCFEDRHKKISANVVELSLEPPMDPALVDPPVGAIELGLCTGKIVSPTLSGGGIMTPGVVDPERLAWLRVWFVIDAKGKPQYVRVLRLASKDSIARAQATLRSWHFKPGTCDGNPVPMPLTMEIPSTPR